MYGSNAYQGVLPVQQPHDVVSNIFYSINARRAMEQQREDQRQFEASQRLSKQASYCAGSKVFVPKTDLSITINPPQKNKLKVESNIFKPSFTFKSKK
jgi:hypothetical protein|tara:strand:- start:173 stop:466 length:294 start_codon:yes stop_codon:yes gene_type:complete